LSLERAETPVTGRADAEASKSEPEHRDRPDGLATESEPEPQGRSEAPPRQAGAHAPDASAVDTEMLRRSWGDVVESLKGRRKMVLFANAQLATVGAYDGETLELVFPPGKEFGARKIEDKRGELVEVLEELFGISPKVRCTVRAGMVAEPEPEDPPASPEAAEALVREQFGAEVVDVVEVEED
jgi:hypothetical protein